MTCSATAGAGTSRGRSRATRSVSYRRVRSRRTSGARRTPGRLELAQLAEREHARAAASSSAASSTTPRATPTTCPYYESIDGQAVARRAVLEDLQRRALPDEPGLREPADFLDTLVMGLDELVREGDERRTMMTVAVHARWSGQAARAAAAAGSSSSTPRRRRASASCAACDIARWWLEKYPPETGSKR